MGGKCSTYEQHKKHASLVPNHEGTSTCGTPTHKCKHGDEHSNYNKQRLA